MQQTQASNEWPVNHCYRMHVNSSRRVWPLDPAAQRRMNGALWIYYCDSCVKMLLFSFCLSHALCCTFTYSVMLCARSLPLNINALYANGLTLAEVDKAPPLNVNLLPHLHALKCQIPPQIIAAASALRGRCPPRATAQKQCGRTVCMASNPNQSPFRLLGHSGFTLCKMKVMEQQAARCTNPASQVISMNGAGNKVQRGADQELHCLRYAPQLSVQRWTLIQDEHRILLYW